MHAGVRRHRLQPLELAVRTPDRCLELLVGHETFFPLECSLRSSRPGCGRLPGLLRGGSKREGEPEPRPRRITQKLQPASMSLRTGLRDREAEAGSLVAPAGGITAEEAYEEAGHVFGRDPGPFVTHGED